MKRVAIAGGGASGALLAVNLLRHTGAEVVLIERGPRVARGAAYGTDDPNHLLNVRADRMSALPDEPGHFADWLEAHGGCREDFAERRAYGAYLGELLADASVPGRFRVVRGEVTDIRSEGGREVLDVDAERIEADVAVLALGNLEPSTPAGIRPEAGVYVGDPWRSDFAAGLGPDDMVVLIGTGLTAIDVALSLEFRGFEGRILAFSRRGLVPRPHSDPSPQLPPPEGLEPRCIDLLRRVRTDAAQVGWRDAIDRLRPVTQALWASADVAERRKFLRHLRPWWDVHRHRIAPSIHARLKALREAGRLHFAAGRIVSLEASQLRWQPPGPSGNPVGAGEPLLDRLLAAGRIRPDPCRIGIDVDAECRAQSADGSASETLRVVGPLTKGAFWEIVAVPDIRGQVRDLALSL